jgi:diaminopimelate decarboxylase
MNLFNKDSDIDFSHFPSLKFENITGIKTPFFFTDLSIVKNRYKTLKKLLKQYWGNKNWVAYSIKTNYFIAKTLTKKNIPALAEVVSLTEYKKAKASGFVDSKIIFNGPYKEDIVSLIKKPLIINIDNLSELETIIKYKNNLKAKIGLRLNSELKPSRFGFNIENGEANLAIERLISNNIEISGLHTHLGFYTSPSVYRLMAIKIISIIRKYNLNPFYLDFGGGFPSHGKKPYGYKKFYYHPIKKYVSEICEPLNKYFFRQSKPFIILEPGRFLVDDSTVLIAKIINCINYKNKQVATVNTSNSAISSVWFRPQIIRLLSKNKDQDIESKEINTFIYGSSCQEDDILFQDKMSLIKKNDYIIFFCVGAYNQNMANNFILKQPKSILI